MATDRINVTIVEVRRAVESMHLDWRRLSKDQIATIAKKIWESKRSGRLAIHQ